MSPKINNRTIRRQQAEERAAERAERSDVEQVKLLGERPGHSNKEIDRLVKSIMNAA